MFGILRWIKRTWQSWEFADALGGLISALGWKGAIVTLLSGLGATFWAYLDKYGPLPAVIAGLITFATVLAILSLLKYLLYRDRPSKAKQVFDFSYGLALEAINLGIERREGANFVQLNLILRNATAYPLRYEVKDISIVIRDRAVPDPTFIMTGGVIARGLYQHFLYPRFDGSAFGASEKAVIKFTIEYGHPETAAFLRRMKQKLDATLRLDEKPGIVYLIVEATDESIT